MQEIQKQVPCQVQAHEDSTMSKGLKGESSQAKSQFLNSHKQQPNISLSRRAQQKQKCCSISDICKRQILRVIFIPLLIVLFLLTIALTFKQNNYQTNDYFYSKNIQINRKIRGVVPPLNETKQDIFGEYKIGLVQKFDIENRRMLENWKVEMWRNESMRISEEGKDGKCWALYKLKFYSSTIFIVKIENHIYVDEVLNSSKRNLQDQLQKNLQGNISTSLTEPSEEITTTINSTTNLSEQTSSFSNSIQNSSIISTTESNTTTTKSNQNTQDGTQLTEKSFCSLDLWGKLSQILYESHIWTFAQDNFYLLEFSQLGDDSNGVLIMKMIEKYPSNV